MNFMKMVKLYFFMCLNNAKIIEKIYEIKRNN